MTYFYMEPEVAGSLGNNTVRDTSVYPPLVSRLHYSFDGWRGGAILEALLCFIVTIPAQRALEAMGATGVKFDHVEISRSEFFKYMHPDRQLPEFAWLKVHGEPARDDFGIAPDRRLVVSQRVLDLFKRLGLSDAIVEPFGIQDKPRAIEAPDRPNAEVVLAKIRREWNQFYRRTPDATRDQLLEKRAEIDAKYGFLFVPPQQGRKK